MAKEHNHSASSIADQLYLARLKLMEYHLRKIRNSLEHYQGVADILVASTHPKRGDVGSVVHRLINRVSPRVDGLQSIVEDLKPKG